MYARGCNGPWVHNYCGKKEHWRNIYKFPVLVCSRKRQVDQWLKPRSELIKWLSALTIVILELVFLHFLFFIFDIRSIMLPITPRPQLKYTAIGILCVFSSTFSVLSFVAFLFHFISWTYQAFVHRVISFVTNQQLEMNQREQQWQNWSLRWVSGKKERIYSIRFHSIFPLLLAAPAIDINTRI